MIARRVVTGLDTHSGYDSSCLEMLPESWHEEADVVVVGSGFAGLAAAIEAGMAGASVVILEKTKGRGGNSAISDGCVAAAGSPFQDKEGIEDSPELLYEDMMKAGLGINYPDLVRTVAEGSLEALQWTMDFLGVRYREKVIQLGGHSVPRTCVPQCESGSGIVIPLFAKIKELGMRIRTRTYLERLHRDKDGSVKGVGVREDYAFPDPRSGTPSHIKVRRAVVLATGGYANDVAFRTIQDPRLDERIDSTNRPSATADTLIEAMRIGAAPVHLSWIQLGPWTSPDEKRYGVGPLFADYVVSPFGILVNPDTGRRFVNELGDRKIRSDAMLSVGKPSIGVADVHGVSLSGKTIDKCVRRNVVMKFNTLEELAEAYRIPYPSLKKTVDQYNDFVRNRRDGEFGKPILKESKPLVHPPYYGMRVWPKVHYTMGGVRINAKTQVIDLAHQPIKGLYAAGEVTGGIHGGCRLGSLAITECLVFGRIAGKMAAADALWC